MEDEKDLESEDSIELVEEQELEDEKYNEAINLPAIVTQDAISVHEHSLQAYLRKVNNIPSLTKEEEFMLSCRYLENQDLESAHRLITSHLKLVVKIALSYRHYHMPLIELISEGNMGLMRAVNKYDPHLGFRLSTYAMWWIKATIQEYILKSWSLVKIGTTANQKKLFFSLKKIKRQLAAINARETSFEDYEQISRDLGLSVKEVEEIDKRLSNFDMSLNQPASFDEQSDEMINFIPETRPSVEVIVAGEEDLANKKKLMQEAMKQLSERELEIIQARRLLEEPETLDILSKKLNISKERVRQIENKAISKMQEYVFKKMKELYGDSDWT